MGKRKRRADHKKTPPPSPVLDTHSSQDSLPEQKSSHVDGSLINPSTSVMDNIDNPVEVSRGGQSPMHPQHNCSRAVLLKHHRHYYGRHYSRRSSCSRAEASTSHGKGTSLHDEKLYFKLSSSKHNSELEQHTESRDRPFCKPEKIRHSLLAKDAASSDSMRLVCGICERLLRRKPYILDNTSSSGLSVVAVLVCGHAYHADCLEQRTCHENRRDPPCPLCASLLSEADASVVQE